MGVTAPDIITYIGVPLAVLGVLPIIYNTIATLATLAKVRRTLRHGRLAGITRGDVVNHVIEVELPRYTIAPLHREEQSSEYWDLCKYPSHIPGGTWTIFNWKSHTIGLKTQRIDYADQLRQPQAEIGFEELISFLLDLGAVPDPAGFRMLRGSGLWVPTGTRLLLSPDGHEPVLTVAPLDDSDGNLSLAVRWSSNWGMRDPASLPPYWVLIRGSASTEPVTFRKSIEKEPSEVQEKEGETEEPVPSKTSKYTPVVEESVIDIRCQVGIYGLISAIADDTEPSLFEAYNVNHLLVDESLSNSTGIWFASAITAFGTTSQTILWNYKIPTELLSFSKKDTIPCGILVLLDIIPESSTPEWATKYDDQEEAREAQFRKMRENTRQMQKESSMTPEQRAKSVRERQIKSHEDFVDTMNANRRRDAQRAETRMIEALQSPKWDHGLVAEHMLTWLKKGGHVEEQHDLKRAVEVLLWRMVNDAKLATELDKMLDSWKAFVDNGGIRKADYLALKENLPMFAYASLMLALIKDSVAAVNGSLAMDLQECIRIWKRVRLG
ncbi:hypothetical protein BGZ60DRAFT_405104 [Tricladium varicosporioides]|nr:hypothetical protein BGZ60DRAFT_405104 [Hymenoscyphus varicosporioides]